VSEDEPQFICERGHALNGDDGTHVHEDTPTARTRA